MIDYQERRARIEPRYPETAPVQQDKLLRGVCLIADLLHELLTLLYTRLPDR